VVWKALEDRSSYASPLAVELAGVRQVVGFTGLRLVGLHADRGTLLWEHDFPALYEQTILTPVVWKDLVVLGGERRPAVALRITTEDGKVNAAVAWRNNDLRSYTSSPVAFKGHLVGLNARNQLVCVDLASGKTAWKGGDFSTHGTLVVAGEQLLVLTRNGELHILEANTRKLVRKARWQLSKSGPVWAHLAVAGPRLYVKDRTDVLCFEPKAR
jgi:outer membrane protein assembly factor BamB